LLTAHGSPLANLRQLASVDGGLPLANFVRSFELNSNNSSHDWHVQPSCQRPIRISAWASRYRSGRIQIWIQPSSKPFKNIVLLCGLSIAWFHRISTSRSESRATSCEQTKLGSLNAHRSLLFRSRTHLPPAPAPESFGFSQQPIANNQWPAWRDGRYRLEKDHLEVLRRTHKPFAKRCPRM